MAEVIVMLLDRDPGSIRFVTPEWQPRRSLIEMLQPAQVAAAREEIRA